MFLLPALGASACDVTIIYLYIHFASFFFSADTTTRNRSYEYWIHIFTCCTAMLRLVQLVGPLQRRVATGTRIVHLGPYILFHTACFIGLCTVFPNVSSPLFSNEKQQEEEEEEEVQSWIFYSSLLSIALHGILLLHVKSSAPTTRIQRKVTLDHHPEVVMVGDEFVDPIYTATATTTTTSKRKLMAYWIYDQYRNKRRDSSLHRGGGKASMNTTAQQGRRRPIRTSSWEDSSNTRFIDTGEESNESGMEMDYQREMMRMEDDHYYDDEQEEDDEEKEPEGEAEHPHSIPASHLHTVWNGETSLASPSKTISSHNSTTLQDLEHGDSEDVETQPFLSPHYAHDGQEFKPPRRNKRDKDKPSMKKSSLTSLTSPSYPSSTPRHPPSAFWKSLSDRQRKIRFIGLPTCFSTEHYDDFFQEIRHRFQKTKRIWVDRLEDFTYRIQVQHHFPPPSMTMPTTMERSHSSSFILHHLTPFRALLQLYAYEEVFTNHKLDRAFSSNGNGGEELGDSDLALTFYAPQLLCFLLHNAYLNTGRLERWILRKCKSNIYFAHKCYWFIRSWCLHSCTLCLDTSDEGAAGLHNSTPMTNGSTPDPSKGGGGLDGGRVTSTTSLSSLLDGWGGKKSQVEENEDSIVSAEERQLMISLLGKIMKCGEMAAGKFESCSTETPQQSPSRDHREETNANQTAVSPLQSETGASTNTKDANDTSSNIPTDWIPTDPTTGCPSISHAMAVQHRLSTNRFPPSSFDRKGSHSLFLQTPRFLDALIAVADDLKMLPRSERNAELQNRLRSLEVDFLPSNSIYVPVNNCMHRVWRIVVSESIAISTKERVPCIVCLEVIDQDKSPSPPNVWAEESNETTHVDGLSFRFGSPFSNNRSEYDTLRSWYMTQRYPQRHNSLLDKVTTYTQQSLKKLRDEIEDTIHHHDQRFFGVNLFTDRHSMANGFNHPLSEMDSTSTMLGTDLVDSSTIEYEVAVEGNIPMDPRMHIKPPLPTTLSSLPSRAGANQVRVNIKADLESTMSPSNTPNSSLPSSRSSSRPSSPTINLGQWTSPSQGTGKRLLVGDKAPKLVIGEIDSMNIRTGTKRRNSIDEGMDGLSNHIRQPSISLSTSTNHEYGSTDYMPLSVVPTLSEMDPSSKTAITRSTVDVAHPSKEKSSSKSSKSPPAIVFKEDWATKQKRLRLKSAFGSHPQWRLLPILIKSNDDLRQEQLASQLIHCMASILARAKVSVWLYPYEIIALTYRGGIIEAIPDTISIDSLKKNDPTYTDLKSFFIKHFGPPTSDEYEGAKANFVESLAAYSIVCYLLQIKDRHNGNILLDNRGHLIHIDFGFFFLSSPGKNSGFESAPFKLTREFVDLMDGPQSRTFGKFRELCCRTFLELRKNCYQITLLVDMLMEGNGDLNCFRGKPEVAVQELQERFCLDLNDRACVEFVNSLVDDSLENWRTTWYDRYQRCFVGVM